MKVAFWGEDFYTWGGGIDFIAGIAAALNGVDEVSTCLVLRKEFFVASTLKLFRKYIQGKCTLKILRDQYSELCHQRRKYTNIINGFATMAPQTKLIFFRYTDFRGLFGTIEKKLEKCLRKNDVDIIFPINGWFDTNFSIPWIGYIYDFQHKYLTNYFDINDSKKRDEDFYHRVQYSRYILVNANTVSRDIKLFYPDSKCKVYVLPFRPFTVEDNLKCENVNPLPYRYFIVSNQFWQHKNHIIVFDALEKLYSEGITDVHVVCTGEIKETRNKHYVKKVIDYIQSLKCKENIHLLGYVDKNYQMNLIKNSIALIQPTLFEGGPGGGATSNALCLGTSCILSNIEVNKEVVGYNNVYFFDPENACDLADQMKRHLDDKHLDKLFVTKKNQDNRRDYGEAVYRIVLDCINKACK